MIWWIIIFFLDMFISYTWATSVQAISNKKAMKAALWSSALSLAGAVSIISFTENRWLIIPAVIGGAIGTYLSVKFNKDDS
jgi:hypothetical protein